MEKNISDMQRRPMRYWAIDGIGELVLGGVFILIGIVAYITHTVPKTSASSAALGSSFQMLAIVLLIVGGRYLISWLKARITYPRTGYVVIDRKITSKSRWLGMGLGLVFGLLFGLAINFLVNSYGTHWLLFYTGTLLGLTLAIAGFKTQTARFYWLAVLTVAAGAFAAWVPASEAMKYMLLFSITGVLMLTSGLLTLQHYLRNSKPAASSGV